MCSRKKNKYLSQYEKSWDLPFEGDLKFDNIKLNSWFDKNCILHRYSALNYQLFMNNGEATNILHN